jgi:hypothetical protein
MGGVLTGALLCILLVAVLGVLLPARLRWLDLAFVVLFALALLLRHWAKSTRWAGRANGGALPVRDGDPKREKSRGIPGKEGIEPWLPHALVVPGLAWLAGHLAFAGWAWPSAALVLFYSTAVWGLLRMRESRRGGMWLLGAGQVLAVALLAAVRQPLPAGLCGVLLLFQVALHLPGARVERPRFQRELVLVLLSMLLAAWALP